MPGLIPAVITGLITFAAGAVLSRWLGVPRRVWFPGGLALSVVVAALTVWVFRPE